MAAAIVIVVLVAGCGSSSSGESTGAGQSNPSQSTSPSQPPSEEPKSDSAGQPSRAIRSSPVRETIVHFGEKASPSEQAAATAAVQTFYTARAEEDWHTACFYLTPGQKLAVKQVGGPGVAGCGKGIKSLTVTSTLRKGETTLAKVASLRRRGDEAFLVYTSGSGAEFGMLIKHVNGGWKLAGFNPTPIG